MVTALSVQQRVSEYRALHPIIIIHKMFALPYNITSWLCIIFYLNWRTSNSFQWIPITFTKHYSVVNFIWLFQSPFTSRTVEPSIFLSLKRRHKHRLFYRVFMPNSPFVCTVLGLSKLNFYLHHTSTINKWWLGCRQGRLTKEAWYFHFPNSFI